MCGDNAEYKKSARKGIKGRKVIQVEEEMEHMIILTFLYWNNQVGVPFKDP